MTDRRDVELEHLRERVLALEAALARARASHEGQEWLADPVLIHDVEGRILSANQRAADLLGYSVDELLHLDLFAVEETLQTSDRAAACDNWQRIEPNLPITARGRFVRREGPTIPVEFTVVARDDPEGRRILLVARDITDRLRVERALRDSEQRFRFLFEASPVGMIRCGPQGNLVQVNRTLGVWLGRDAAALPGTLARDLVAPDDRSAFDSQFAALRAADQRHFHANMRFVSPRGYLWGRVTLFAEADGRGDLRQIIGVVEDLDARVKAEIQVSALLASLEGQVETRTAELRRSNEQLRVEIEERERAEALLVRARERAEAASRAKSRFLMVMSHELRTPLNAIIGYSEMHIDSLLAGIMLEPQEILTDLRRIHTAGHHLLAHINDILQMTRLEADARLAISRLELVPFLHELAEATRAQLAGPEIELSLALGADLGILHTDAGKLQHILRHLLHNAAKFTHQGRIELVAMRESGGDLRFDVCDTGIGISREQLGMLFIPFVQLDDSPTRRYGGLGLGLALCRRYCDELGGSIAVESVLGRGSRFTIRIPVAPPANLE